MAKDLTVYLTDRPGTIADMGEALGNAGINIDGMCGFPCEGRGVIHILVEDADAARAALEGAGIEVGEARDVILFEGEDRPGMLGEAARKIANAGVNFDLLYKTTATTIVIGVNDLDSAKSALGQ